MSSLPVNLSAHLPSAPQVASESQPTPPAADRTPPPVDHPRPSAKYEGREFHFVLLERSAVLTPRGRRRGLLGRIWRRLFGR
jgi:hypothetical protein